MPPRVLHLIEPRSSGWPAACAVAALVAEGSAHVSHRVAVIGSPREQETAEASGLRADIRIVAALGAPELAAPALRRAVSRSGERISLVHAWSPACLALGRLARVGSALTATISEVPETRAWRLRRHLAMYGARGAQEISFTSQFAQSAWHASSLGGAASSVLRLPLAPVAMDDTARRALRAEWGVDDETLVILPTGEPLRRMDARWFAFRTGVLSVAGVRAAVVLPRQSESLERALRFVERHNVTWKVIIEEGPLYRVIPACDMALWRAGERHPDSMMWGAHTLALAAAHGLACVAEDHPLSRELLSMANAPQLCPIGNTVAISSAIFEVADALCKAPARPARSVMASTLPEWLRRMQSYYLRACGTDAGFPEAHLSPA